VDLECTENPSGGLHQHADEYKSPPWRLRSSAPSARRTSTNQAGRRMDAGAGRKRTPCLPAVRVEFREIAGMETRSTFAGTGTDKGITCRILGTAETARNARNLTVTKSLVAAACATSLAGELHGRLTRCCGTGPFCSGETSTSRSFDAQRPFSRSASFVVAGFGRPEVTCLEHTTAGRWG
jgi:hypothetical protein